MDNHFERIIEILGEDCEKNDENINQYYNYLKNNITFPCVLTGIEDFPWEEKYVFGGWDKKEYERLKKDNPSYTDQFDLIELVKPESGEDDLFINAKRLSDKKVFELELSWLKCVDPKSNNYLLLHDFSVWQVNY
jgi:hypothetical protein